MELNEEKPIKEWLEMLIEPYRTVALRCAEDWEHISNIKVMSLARALGRLPLGTSKYSTVPKAWYYVYLNTSEFINTKVSYQKYLR